MVWSHHFFLFPPPRLRPFPPAFLPNGLGLEARFGMGDDAEMETDSSSSSSNSTVMEGVSMVVAIVVSSWSWPVVVLCEHDGVSQTLDKWIASIH